MIDRFKVSAKRQHRLSVWIVGLVLVTAWLAVCWGMLGAPFIGDDNLTIVSNESITRLWPPVGTAEQPGPLRPPVSFPTAGRPLVNLSFAVNYSLGGLQPNAYHAV